MLESLNSARYERFVSSFTGMLRRGQEGEDSGEGLAHEPVTTVAPDLVSRRHRKWLKAGKRLADAPSPEDYHELRKEGKRLRYTLEFLTDVYGKKPVGKLVGPLKELQDGLGRHQDAIVAADLLEGLAADGGRRLSPLTAFKMGVLSERYLQEAADLRASLPRSKPYRAMTKDKVWKGFEKVMEKRHNSVEKARAKAGAKAEDGKKAKAKGGKKK
jgi:CHAD domain-containing protein